MPRTRWLSLLLVIALVTPALASVEEPPEFVLKWGSPGAGDGQFNGALVVDFGPDGHDACDHADWALAALVRK